MATAVSVRVGAELKLAIRFEWLNPALDRAGNGWMIVVDATIHDGDAHTFPAPVTPDGLRIVNPQRRDLPSRRGIKRPRRPNRDHVVAAASVPTWLCI